MEPGCSVVVPEAEEEEEELETDVDSVDENASEVSDNDSDEDDPDSDDNNSDDDSSGDENPPPVPPWNYNKGDAVKVVKGAFSGYYAIVSWAPDAPNEERNGARGMKLKLTI